jgi:hypothetical protein
LKKLKKVEKKLEKGEKGVPKWGYCGDKYAVNGK